MRISDCGLKVIFSLNCNNIKRDRYETYYSLLLAIIQIYTHAKQHKTQCTNRCDFLRYNAVIPMHDVQYAFTRTNKTVVLVSHVHPRRRTSYSTLDYIMFKRNGGIYLSHEYG